MEIDPLLREQGLEHSRQHKTKNRSLFTSVTIRFSIDFLSNIVDQFAVAA
jgi:hypothetical protein